MPKEVLPVIIEKNKFFQEHIAPMPEAKKKNKYLSYLIRFIVAAVALYFAFRDKPKETVDALLRMNWWIFAAALGIYIISQLIFVSRWYLLLWVQSIRIGYWSAVRLHFLGLFYNNCLPSSVGGDLLRAWYVTKHTDRKVQAALSVFVDRVIGLAGSIIMAVGCYWFIPEEGRSAGFGFSQAEESSRILTDYKGIILLVALIFIFCLAIFGLTAKGRAVLRRWVLFIEEHGLRILQRVHESIRIYYNSKLALCAAMLLTFACQSVFIMGIWMVGKDIGIGAHFKYYFIFFPISWVIGSLPISVGGAGVTEWWLKDIFVRVCGVPSPLAQALAACQRLLWIFGSLPGAIIHLLGAHLPEDSKYEPAGLEEAEEFSIDYKKPVN